MRFHRRTEGVPFVGPPSCTALLVGNGRGGAVELRGVDGERLVIGLRPILQDAERNLLAQED